MKHGKLRPTGWILLAIGILLAGGGWICLQTVPDLYQYAFLPGADTAALSENLEKARTGMGGAFGEITIHGQKTDVTLSADSASRDEVCLYLTGPGWSEVCPRKYLSGRPISRAEAESKAKVIVLDEATAFRLFGAESPEGKTVKLDGETLEVIGVAEHSRRIGETGGYAAWTTFGASESCELMVVTAKAPAGGKMTEVFRSAAEEAFGTGTMISMPKEKQRATMILRWPALIAAIWALKSWIGVFSRFGRKQWEKIRKESKKRYAGSLIPYVLLQLLPVAIGIAATVGIGYVLAVVAVEPARMFPEWVPESLGDFSSWAARFRSLTGEAAAPVSLRTPELAEIRFFGGLIRWGLVLGLLGTIRLMMYRFFPHRGQES